MLRKQIKVKVVIYTLLLASLVGTPQLLAQRQIYAELSGVITDASGARAPGVSVVARHIATQFTREVRTNDSGFYLIGSLPVGDYQLSAELAGFRKYVQSGITLGGEDRKVIDIRLEVGEVTNQIEVTSTAPLVDRADATLGVNLEPKTIETLPLNGRDFTALLRLQAGAITGDRGAFPSSSGSGGVLGSASPGDSVGVSFNGAHDSWSSNNITMDGIDISLISSGLVTANSISMESIGEMVVDTTNYSAENGRSAGAKVNILSKGGTNNFHGSAFEFHRGTRFQANDFFLNAAGRPRPEFSRHQFGGAIGGPIRKDKLFFFFSYEGIRIDQPASYLINSVTQEFRNRLDPALLAYIKHMPLPTQVSPSDPRLGTVLLTGRDTNDNNILMPRIDWNFGPHQIFGRWNRSRTNSQRGAYPNFPSSLVNDRDNFSIQWNMTLSPTTTNGFGWGAQQVWSDSSSHIGFWPRPGDKGPFPAPPCPGCGRIVAPWWPAGTVPYGEQVPSENGAYFFNDNFRLVRGAHQISTGFEYRHSIHSAGRIGPPDYTFQTLDDLAKNSPITANNTWGYDPALAGDSGAPNA